MYGYFAFEVRPQDTPNRWLVIFCATSDPQADAVNAVIRRYGEQVVSPDRIILLGMKSERGRLAEIATDEQLKDLLPAHTRYVDPPAILAATIPREGLTDDRDVAGTAWRQVRLAGLAAIFKQRNALLVAPPTHHFSKPSTRHCDRFIRAANALVDGAEITFIAACCLGYVPDTVRHFYCDTGGISVVAFAIDSLRRRFDHAVGAATVNTFESYGGLKKFVFRESESSIVLVSASTSGGLEEEICRREQRFRPEQIVTLFSVGAARQGSNVLLNLEEDGELRQSLGDFRSYEHAECPLCEQGSIAVPMMGDQFIPARSYTRSVLVVRTDAPAWLGRFLEACAGREWLRAYYRSPNTLHAAQSVFVDLERAFTEDPGNSPLVQRVDRLVLQSVPAATRRLLHLDDPASERLARRIAAQIAANHPGGNPVEICSANGADGLTPLQQGASVVVAAAVASGQSLLAVSQTLRNLQTNGAISYVIALTRMATVADQEKLERDLRMGELPSDYAFGVAERIHLPLVGRNAGCSWGDELQLLQEWANTADGPLRGALEARIEILRGAQGAAQRGFARRLFWPSVQDQELTLRHGFVYLPRGIAAAQTSQGDVYFVMASVLHHLRCGNGAKSSLRQTEYERRVLSPLCFDRFNDGVVQAAILRAVAPPELDYSASPEESQRMTAVLRSIFGAAAADKGEASREFLLAMALGRLVLTRADIQSLHAEFGTGQGDLISEAMWKYIDAKYLR